MTAFYAPLQQEALLHINGPDALAFLQGQTTCDTRKVDAGQATPGAYCTPKGRMVCDFLLLQLGPDHHALRMRRDILDHAAATFGKYIVFSKAEIETQRTDWQVIGCWGDELKDRLNRLGITSPGERYGVSAGEGYVLVQLDDAGTQYEAYIDMQQHAEHFAALEDALQAGTESAWQAQQIRAGIGRVEAATIEEFLPQMLNYDVTGHVSFNKGCYTGQEIVARLHYRGKAKRRMYLAGLNAAAPIPAGTSLYSPGSDQATGTVVNSSVDEHKCLCLVSATESGIASGLYPEGTDSLLILASLPYTLAEDGA
ncbi:folate-binding protein YgfZ [Pseudohalioglobus sediminis]|uniref:Folate-binding protein YgfZ n=1 Tax=Pseudohalioglobus sediminis TaxID=2606449 RepID=A0A5B0X279_9GAMM|nr:folate-binding protein YgfZ [Pseudohalioglobus sediminis]KAA1193356.1 folate-binding protein YgfZ [Pseudohalioglobus sediminis]